MTTSSESDRGQFFQPVADTIHLSLKLPACIWLLNEAGDALQVVAAAGLPEDYTRRAILHLDKPSVASDVYRTGQIIVVKDIASEQRWKYKRKTLAIGLRSAMVVPLRVKQKIVGVLDVYAREVRDFSEPEKSLTEHFAAQIAATQRRIHDLKIMNEVSLLITSELDLADLLKRITQSAERVLDCEHISIFMVSDSGDLVLEAVSSPGIARTKFAPGEGLAGWVAQKKASLLVPDVREHADKFARGRSSSVEERSMLLVPIISEDEVIGVISADMDGLDGFDAHDQTLLEALAGQAALAVRNARLLDQTTKRAEVLQQLHEIGEQMFAAEPSARRLKKVLRQVARSARQVLGADLVDVYQYVESEDRYIVPPIQEGKRRDRSVVKDAIFKDDVVVGVIEGGEPLYCSEAQDTALLTRPYIHKRPQSPDKRFVVREGVQSSAAIPLKAAGETVGAMFVNYRMHQGFDLDQQGSIELFANQAATAIYNARVFESARARIEALQSLNEVSQQLSAFGEKTLRSLLQQVARQAKKVLDADLVEIYQYSPTYGDAVATHVSVGKYLSETRPSKVLPDSIILQILGRSTPLFAADAQQESILSRPFETDRRSLPEQRFVIREQISSTAAVPLRVDSKAVGVLFVNYRKPQRFLSEQRDLIQLFANQAAIALYNARQSERLRALVEVGQDLTAKIRLSQDDVLTSIYEQTRRLMGAQNMYVALYDNQSQVARFVLAVEDGRETSVGIGKWSPRKLNPDSRGKTEDIILTRKPILHQTVTQAEAWYKETGHKRPADPFASSWMGVPIALGNRVLGTIAIYDWKREYAYDQHDLRVLSSVANQAAIALHNARLFHNVERSRRALVEFGQAVAASIHRNEQEILGLIYKQTSKLMDTANMSIALYDEVTDKVRFGLAMRDGKPIDVEEEPGWKPRPGQTGKGKTNDIIRRKKPILLSTKEEEEAWFAEEEGRERQVEPRASYLGVPMMLGKKVVGVIDIYSLTEEYLYDEDDLAVMQAIANHAAIALDNAHMFYDVDQRRRALVKFGQAVASGVNLGEEKILEFIYERASQLMSSDSISIVLYDKETDIIRFGLAIQDGIRVDTEKEEGWGPRPGSVGKGKTNKVIRTKKPLLFQTKDQLEQWYDLSETVRYIPRSHSSWLGVPMMLGNRVLGVIDCSHKTQEYAYSQDDVEVLQAIANYAAVALDNAHLLQQTQRQLEQLKTLNQISELLMEERDVRETIRLLMKQTLQLFNADHGSFWGVDYAHQCLRLEFSIGRSGEASSWQDEAQEIVVPLDADSSIAGNTAVTRNPNLWNQVTECPYWNDEFDKQTGYKSKRMLAVPLLHRFEAFKETKPIASLAQARRITQDRAIGVLQLLNTVDEADFTDDDRQFLLAIAKMAAIALHDAETHEREVALSEIGRALTAGGRLREHEILRLIHQQIGCLMDANNMYIALYDQPTDTVRFGLAFVDGRAVDVETEDGWQPRKAGKGRTEEIIRTRKPIFHATEAIGNRWYKRKGRKEYVGGALPSWLGVPMVAGEKELGVIAVYHPSRDYVYSCDDLEVLRAIADQAAVALDNANLYYEVNRQLEEANRQLERRVKDLDALNKVGRALSAEMDLDETAVLESIYEQTHTLTGTRDMYIALYDEPTKTIRFGLAMEAGERVPVGVGGWAPRKADLEKRGKTEEIIFTKQPILHCTFEESQGWYDQPGHGEFLGLEPDEVQKSYLGVPMLLGDQVLGVIAIYDWEKERAYDEQFLQVISSMADHAAIALEKARLYNETLSLRDEVTASKQLATLGTAIAVLQHRINNSFNIIVPNLMRMRKRVDLTDAETVEILDLIDRSAHYTSQVITRIQEPLREVTPQDVDVNAVLNEVVSRADEQRRGTPSLPPIQSRLDLEDTIPHVWAPIGQITEVFQNLVDNACRAMKKGGSLTVTSCLTEGMICVRVQDTGPGIPPQIRQRLFNKPVPSKTPGGGAGLGLWLSQLILLSIRGSVRIEKTDSSGTTILVEIPANLGRNRG